MAMKKSASEAIFAAVASEAFWGSKFAIVSLANFESELSTGLKLSAPSETPESAIPRENSKR